MLLVSKRDSMAALETVQVRSEDGDIRQVKHGVSKSPSAALGLLGRRNAVYGLTVIYVSRGESRNLVEFMAWSAK